VSHLAPEPFQNKQLFSSQFSQCQHPFLGFLVFFCNQSLIKTRVLYLHGLLRDMFSRMLNNPRSVKMGIVNFIVSSQHVQ
jgi:hypothetical protein